jgi:hypothetical protein
MTSELDIYRTANILVKEYGLEQAPLMAAKRADALLELGDIEGQQIWKAVLRAVQELIRLDRKPGERISAGTFKSASSEEFGFSPSNANLSRPSDLFQSFREFTIGRRSFIASPESGKQLFGSQR